MEQEDKSTITIGTKVLCVCIPWIGLILFFKNRTNNKKYAKECLTMSLLGWVITIILTIASMGGSSSKWDSLTKEEKQWYKNSYGNGKSQEYTDAIDKYKSTH